MHLKKHKYWNIVIKFYNWMTSSTVPYIFSLPDPLTHFFLFLVLICQNCFESIEWKEHSFKYIKRYIDALTTPKGCAATTSTSPTFSLPSFPQQLFPFHPLCSAWNRPSYQFSRQVYSTRKFKVYIFSGCLFCWLASCNCDIIRTIFNSWSALWSEDLQK